MSFANDVKKELVNHPLSECCIRSQLAALIILSSEINLTDSKQTISLRTTSLPITRFILGYIKKIYQVNPKLTTKERKSLDFKKVYTVIITERVQCILRDLEIIDETNERLLEISPKLIRCENCANAFLRGAFLGRGSINNPYRSNYHLEIVAASEAQANFLIDVFAQFNLSASMIERAKGFVVYLKKGESIGDFLRIVGATNSLFIFEDARIKRDLSNSINRIINCDLANSTRTLKTAQRHLNHIKIIEENIGYEELSPRLMEAIILRTTHPESSLAELSEVSEEVVGRRLSKSGLNHCFRDLAELAEKWE